MRAGTCMLIILLFSFCFDVYGQKDDSFCGEENFPHRFFQTLNAKVNRVENNLSKQSEKWLKKLQRQEEKLKKKLARKDSFAAEQLFGDVNQRYQQLENKLNSPIKIAGRTSEYLPNFDTLKTSIKFLSAGQDLLPNAVSVTEKSKAALANLNGLEGKLNQAADIKKYLQERRGQLKEQLSKFDLVKDLKQFNKQAYYYGEQINQYKAMLNDPAKLEQKAVELIKKLPAFQEFCKNNSELASLFRLPDNYASVESLAGLQTRESVQALVQNRIAAGGPNAMSTFQNNLQEAQNQLTQLKDKINQLGNAGDAELPDFKPNNQKTKTFLQRLEYGTNLQSQRSNNFFPTTTDLGLSVGYKLNNAGIIGVGASYKIGWGKDLRNINVSSQGVGLRSFVDYKIKGSFFASGGFEYNYQQPFNSINAISNLDTWQKSGLLGVSKILSLKSKLFKKTRLQLFWDFLSSQQRPQSEAIKFRVGYNF